MTTENKTEIEKTAIVLSSIHKEEDIKEAEEVWA
jgi:hypothetical protein